MQRKLGPLKTWQWLAMGAALGAAIYLYRRNRAGASSGATPNAAAVDPSAGPIDPTTGMPYAMGSAGGQATDPFAPDGSFANALALLEEIQNSGLFGGTSEPTQVGVVAGATGDNDHKNKQKHKRSTTRNKGHSHGRPPHHDKHKPHPAGTTGSAGAGHNTKGGRTHPNKHRPETAVQRGQAMTHEHEPTVAHHQHHNRHQHSAAYGHARRSY